MHRHGRPSPHRTKQSDPRLPERRAATAAAECADSEDDTVVASAERQAVAQAAMRQVWEMLFGAWEMLFEQVQGLESLFCSSHSRVEEVKLLLGVINITNRNNI